MSNRVGIHWFSHTQLHIMESSVVIALAFFTLIQVSMSIPTTSNDDIKVYKEVSARRSNNGVFDGYATERAGNAVRNLVRSASDSVRKIAGAGNNKVKGVTNSALDITENSLRFGGKKMSDVGEALENRADRVRERWPSKPSASVASWKKAYASVTGKTLDTAGKTSKRVGNILQNGAETVRIKRLNSQLPIAELNQ